MSAKNKKLIRTFQMSVNSNMTPRKARRMWNRMSPKERGVARAQMETMLEKPPN